MKAGNRVLNQPSLPQMNVIKRLVLKRWRSRFIAS